MDSLRIPPGVTVIQSADVETWEIPKVMPESAPTELPPGFMTSRDNALSLAMIDADLRDEPVQAFVTFDFGDGHTHRVSVGWVAPTGTADQWQIVRQHDGTEIAVRIEPTT